VKHYKHRSVRFSVVYLSEDSAL